MKRLALQKLDALFAAICAQQTLYIPADDAAGQAQFTPWKPGLTLSKRLNTVRSAKDLFFPQVEDLAGFKREGKHIEIFETSADPSPFAVFGVRACDARSFALLDSVFLKEPVDTFYQSRREMGTILTIACARPEETCFCRSFGIDPGSPAGDVSCWMDEANLYWQGADRLPFHAGGLRGRRCAGAAGKNPWNSGTAAACEARSVRRRRGEDEAAV